MYARVLDKSPVLILPRSRTRLVKRAAGAPLGGRGLLDLLPPRRRFCEILRPNAEHRVLNQVPDLKLRRLLFEKLCRYLLEVKDT